MFFFQSVRVNVLRNEHFYLVEKRPQSSKRQHWLGSTYESLQLVQQNSRGSFDTPATLFPDPNALRHQPKTPRERFLSLTQGIANRFNSFGCPCHRRDGPGLGGSPGLGCCTDHVVHRCNLLHKIVLETQKKSRYSY